MFEPTLFIETINEAGQYDYIENNNNKIFNDFDISATSDTIVEQQYKLYHTSASYIYDCGIYFSKTIINKHEIDGYELITSLAYNEDTDTLNPNYGLFINMNLRNNYPNTDWQQITINSGVSINSKILINYKSDSQGYMIDSSDNGKVYAGSVCYFKLKLILPPNEITTINNIKLDMNFEFKV